MSVLDELATRAGYVSFCAFLIASGSAHAAKVTLPNVAVPRGAPIAQNFLDSHGDSISLLATGNGMSCVASRTLSIASSVYVEADGTSVDFKDVIRSPATSVQAIARPGSEIAFRIQMKFSPDTAKPISLDVSGQTLDLATSLEPSSDSLWLTGTTAQILAEALRQGESPKLSATSGTSGHLVVDQITAPDMAGIEACLITLDALLGAQKPSEGDVAPIGGTPLAGGNQDDGAPTPTGITGRDPQDAVVLASVDEPAAQPTLPVPVAGLRLEFVARPDPATRIAPSALEKCRMSNIPENVYLGRLTSVTGFFAQTQDVYVAFDAQGQVQRAYIPGVFDSELRPEGGSARVSLAADTNLPDQTNRVKGCLGDALMEAQVCVASEEGSDRHTIAECGVLGTSESRYDVVSPLEDFASPGLTVLNPLRAVTDAASAAPVSFGAGIRRLGFGAPGGGSTPRPDFGKVPGSFLEDGDTPPGGDGGDGDDGHISPVPLPAGIWLMLAALAGMVSLPAVARRREGQVRHVAGSAPGR